MTYRTLLLAAILLGVGVLAACSTSATSGPSTPASASSATPGAATADGSAAHPLAFGSQWAPPGKLPITIGAPAPFTPSVSAFDPAKSARAVVMDVSVTNLPSAPAIPALAINIQATAGDQQVQQIMDTAAGVGSPTASILPGKTLAWKVAFGLPAGQTDLVVQVGTIAGGQTVYWAGKA